MRINSMILPNSHLGLCVAIVHSVTSETSLLSLETMSSTQEHIKRIVDGFRIRSMNIRDAASGALLWEQHDWDRVFEEELEVHVPASVLRCAAVSREMEFTSQEKIDKFRLVQTVTLMNTPIEEWRFDFGFVIPGSTNSWQCTIESAGRDQMIPAEILSGNVVIETAFYDRDLLVCRCRMRVYYHEDPAEKSAPDTTAQYAQAYTHQR